ncbi:biotin carboxylase N-terminal domain-containing protein [Streptomyces sp. NPDC058964]|uniref:biotin carboxylase N-terminal domain-containing protein n=1 Tax=Streptomyces sp. NPDC058964 TaxID=3346681 RepID=UPI00367B13BB
MLPACRAPTAGRSRCALLRPGRGFPSENPGFALRCAAAGITFAGPSPEAVESRRWILAALDGAANRPSRGGSWSRGEGRGSSRPSARVDRCGSRGRAGSTVPDPGGPPGARRPRGGGLTRSVHAAQEPVFGRATALRPSNAITATAPGRPPPAYGRRATTSAVPRRFLP